MAEDSSAQAVAVDNRVQAAGMVQAGRPALGPVGAQELYKRARVRAGVPGCRGPVYAAEGQNFA